MSTKSVDDLIAKVETAKLSPEPPVVEPVKNEVAEEVKEVEAQDHVEDAKPLNEEKPSTVYNESDNKEEKASNDEDVESSASSEDLDDYGNKKQKDKLYTAEEVQEMMRDRLKRVKHETSQPPPQPQYQESQPLDNSGQEVSWEEELDQKIDRRVEERERNRQEREWQAQELQRQAEFETKFTTGMERYTDFRDVIKGKPITNSMMLAARNLEDPAAFIYAASKNHAEDLNRIAKIGDPYAQAAEIGRLEAKMRKKSAVSKASKPLNKAVSDVANKSSIHRPPIDDLIRQHARNKFNNGR